ncbi:MAG: hypothetical protein EHM43_10135, partial [Ignavibacteriae bacterium]
MTKKPAKSSGSAQSAAPVVKAAGAASLSPGTKQKTPLLPIAPKKGLKYSDKDLSTFRGAIERAKEDAMEELRMLRERLE